MHGCNGRMGQVITEMIAKEAEMEIVAGVDLSDHIQNSYPVFKSMKDCDVEADVVIDFANAKAVDGLLDVCVERNLPCVLCTTGLSEEQLAHVKEASGKVAILRSANMSMGINLLMKLLKDAVPVLAAAGYDMEITFNRKDVLEPLVEMEEQICGSTGEAFNTVHGDGKLRLNQPTAYTSYFSTNENFVLQYVTMSVNNKDGSYYGTVGTFVNILEWISEAEAEKLKEQGY